MLASNKQFVQWILKVKSNIDSGQFKPMQHAAVEALAAPKAWYDKMNETYRSRRALAGEIMHTLGCTYDENQVGMFLWGRIPDIYNRFIRISLCCNNQMLQEALTRIQKVIK